MPEKISLNLSKDCSIIRTFIYPLIKLEMALHIPETYNSIPNVDENNNLILPKRFNEKISEECIRYWNEKGNLGIKFMGGKYNDLIFGDTNYNFLNDKKQKAFPG